jgi:pimeloyl-ACP methyl ester carboxylesterase
MNVTQRAAMFAVLLLIPLATLHAADESKPGKKADAANARPESSPKTMGGQMFWADELIYFGWRIQRNTFTGHCRLLDENQRRHAFGTFEQCNEKLEEINRRDKLPPMKGKVVLVLAGLGDARMMADDMVRFLHDRGGYWAGCVAYPSLFDEIGQHARSLDSVVQHLDCVDEINFVGHSMGNLVIRRYLGDQTGAGEGKKQAARQADKRIKRIVMLGPPNQGAELAERLGDNSAFLAVFGPSGQQLGKRWKELQPTLATPQCEFGIIAGGKGDDHGYNPLLPGDNDGIVTVASTRLAGARDFLLVHEPHFFLFRSRDVQSRVLEFLKHGYFVSEAKRQPIQ